ncbi:MAG: phosphatase PAP2 family protein [Ilumatobacteraceae bacterium]|nr:phosphatase PAP2 family protein [Ilumatobacteraceae bacterium]
MVFVPAVMSAGIAFSLASLARDLLHRGTGAVVERDGRLRGEVVAAVTVEGATHGTTPATRGATAPRWSFAVVGVGAGALAVYLAIGATANHFRAGGYVEGAAWVWAAFALVVVAASTVAAAALVSAWRQAAVPPWAWAVLEPTPLYGVDEDGRAFEPSRWVSVAAGVAFVFLTVVATWQDKLRPIDASVGWLVDHPAVADIGVVGVGYGSIITSIVVVLVVAVSTRRCRRLGSLLLIAVLVAGVASGVARIVVRRPRPDDPGALDAYPAGQVVQAVVLAILVPLVVREIVRRRWVERLVAVLLGVAAVAVAAHVVTDGTQSPTDVLGGVLLGVAVATWVRAVLVDATGHARCRGCALSAPREDSS